MKSTYPVKFTKQAAKDARQLKSAGLDTKAKELIALVEANPWGTPPSYEKLVGNLSGLYSRRISLQHRFVYQIIPGAVTEHDITYEGVVKVIRMWTHYDDIR